MTRPLFHALFARWAVFAVAMMVLGGLAVQAAQTRPAPLDRSIAMVCYEPGSVVRVGCSL